MKRFLALCVSAILVLTCLAGALVVSAESSTPAFLIEGIALNPVNGAYDCGGSYDFDAGYITLTVNGTDPYYNIIAVAEETPVTVADYMVIKYRTTTEGLKGAAYMCYNSDIVTLIGEGYDVTAEFDYIGDGEWHEAVIYLPEQVATEAYDPETKALKYMRFDFIDVGIAAGQTLDVEYVAFFSSESEIEEFVHVPPEMVNDGSFKTLDFGNPEEVATMFDPNNKIDITYSEGLGYTTFTSTGTDPYIRFMDSNDNAGDFGVVGYEAAYILVKYRTTANSQAKTEIMFFTNCGATQWGADGSYASTELVVNPTEGEGAGDWHYAVVDATAAWGGSSAALYAFRMDPLSTAVEGETIDIAEIKFFAQESYMLDYLDGLAEEGDEAAIDYFDRLPCTHATTEEIPAVAPTCTEDGSTAGLKCTDKCGEIIQNPRPVKARHTAEDVAAKEPTETEAGHTAGKKCSVCGEIIEGMEPIPATGPATNETESTGTEDTGAVDTDNGNNGSTETENNGQGEGNVTESESTTDEAGCKGVIASAAVLSVVALAAGVVICRKKD